MPTIKNPVALSQESIQKIDSFKLRVGFDHHTWSDPELECVRREIRNHYRKEQRYACAYCQATLSVISAEACPVEHIAPKSLYPQFMFEPKNLCVICSDCNNYKSQRETLDAPPVKTNNKRKYPLESAKFRCYHPHIDNYQDHIKKAGFLYIEMSKRGGYTIFMCNLNRYLQEFGVSQEFLDSLDTIAAQEVFHQTAVTR